MRICVPWRPDGGQRDRLWQVCWARWRALFPDATIVAGFDHREPFNRSAARNAAAGADWDVAVFADADIMADTAMQVHAAVAAAAETGRMIFAHTWRAGFGEAVTDQIIEGANPGSLLADRDEWDPNTFSGVYAVPRPLWDAVGGFDERFQGWGFEDLAFMRACQTLAGVDRVPGTIYHLWHPRPRAMQEEHPLYAANHILYDRYFRASGDADAMRAVLAR